MKGQDLIKLIVDLELYDDELTAMLYKKEEGGRIIHYNIVDIFRDYPKEKRIVFELKEV